MSLEESIKFREREFKKMLENLRNLGVPIYYAVNVNTYVTEVLIRVDLDDMKRYGETKIQLLKDIEQDTWRYRAFVVDDELERSIYIFDTVYEIMYKLIY